jgi:16S rRNA pseudouridine516 synthase
MNYYMFNKPFGCVTAHKDDRYPVVMDYFKELQNEKLSPVGRLDRETVGLLLVTDDGIWNQSIIHPREHIEKTYEYIAMGTLDQAKIDILESGIMLKGADRLTAPAKVSVTGTDILANVLPTLHPEIQAKTCHNRPEHPIVTGQITITEGKKHQIRRMMKSVGCLVLYLKRISIGDIQLDPGLKEGEWKELHF